MIDNNSVLPETMRLILQSGVGGCGAERATTILAQMYQRYAVRHHWGLIILDSLSTPQGEYQYVVFVIQGERAYERLRYETGIHRMQEIPPFATRSRMHTSTVLVISQNIPAPEHGIPASPFRVSTGQLFDAPKTKIRTYNVPQERLTDHRIYRSFTPLDQFLAGDLEPLLDALADAGDMTS